MSATRMQTQHLAQQLVAALILRGNGRQPAVVLAAAGRVVAQAEVAYRPAQQRVLLAQLAGAYLSWFDGQPRGWQPQVLSPADTACDQPVLVWQADGQQVADVVLGVRAGQRVLDATVREVCAAHWSAAEQAVGALAGVRLIAPLAPTASRLLTDLRRSGEPLATTAWWTAPTPEVSP